MLTKTLPCLAFRKVRDRDAPLVIFAACRLHCILSASDCILPTMNFLTSVYSSMPLHWWLAFVVSLLGLIAICIRALETEDSRVRRAERNKKKELRSLAARISSYGLSVHLQYPTGDVIVSERDLAEQFRKHPDAVITALTILLGEQKVQRAPLKGYWK
jgi:heme exporter protein D